MYTPSALINHQLRGPQKEPGTRSIDCVHGGQVPGRCRVPTDCDARQADAARAEGRENYFFGVVSGTGGEGETLH